MRPYTSAAISTWCAAVIYRVLQCVAVCCSVLQCVAVCCRATSRASEKKSMGKAFCALHFGYHRLAVCCSGLQGVAVICRVLQCVAVCCSVLQCVAVCCSAVFRSSNNRARARHLVRCMLAAGKRCVAGCCSAM